VAGFIYSVMFKIGEKNELGRISQRIDSS